MAADLAKSRLLVNERDATIRMLQEELQMTVELAKNRLLVHARDDTIRMLQLQLKMAHSETLEPTVCPGSTNHNEYFSKEERNRRN